MASHTTSGEWKSFELRMRRRRAERLLLRADIAAEAGFIEDARAALAEAQRLFPALPHIAAVEQRIRAANGSTSAPAVTRRYPRHAYAAIVAGLVILASGGVWETWHVPHLPAHSVAAGAAVAPQVGQPSAAPPRVGVLVEHLPLVAMIGTSGRPNADASTGSAQGVADRSVQSATARGSDRERDLAASFVSSRSASAIELPADSVQPVADVSVRTATAPPVLNVGQPVTPIPSMPSPKSDADRAPNAAAEDALVRRTLGRYAAAYSSLDADAAQAVWPSVNRGALARAFDDLASQQVSLGDCRIDVNGERARATCTGSMTWAPKIGSGTLRTEPRNWRFDLGKSGDDWQILTARIQNR